MPFWLGESLVLCYILCRTGIYLLCPIQSTRVAVKAELVSWKESNRVFCRPSNDLPRVPARIERSSPEVGREGASRQWLVTQERLEIRLAKIVSVAGYGKIQPESWLWQWAPPPKRYSLFYEVSPSINTSYARLVDSIMHSKHCHEMRRCYQGS